MKKKRASKPLKKIPATKPTPLNINPALLKSDNKKLQKELDKIIFS